MGHEEGGEMSAFIYYVLTGYMACSYADENYYQLCVCSKYKAIPAIYVTVQQKQEKVLI